MTHGIIYPNKPFAMKHFAITLPDETLVDVLMAAYGLGRIVPREIFQFSVTGKNEPVKTGFGVFMHDKFRCQGYIVTGVKEDDRRSRHSARQFCLDIGGHLPPSA